MAKKKLIKWEATLGHYAFIAGLFLALIAPLVTEFIENIETRIVATTVITVTFAALGIIVGILNITAKEVTEFLVAVLVLLISFATTERVLRIIPTIGNWLATVWGYAIVFSAFAAIIVAIKAVYALAQKK